MAGVRTARSATTHHRLRQRWVSAFRVKDGANAVQWPPLAVMPCRLVFLKRPTVPIGVRMPSPVPHGAVAKASKQLGDETVRQLRQVRLVFREFHQRVVKDQFMLPVGEVRQR